MKVATTFLVFSVGALLALGLVMLYSSSMNEVGTRYLKAQSIWCGLGLVACVAAAMFDHRHLKKFSGLFLVGAAILLILVLIPGIGFATKGARRWFKLGFMNLQPSELAKLAVICFLATYGSMRQRQMKTFVKGLVVPTAIVGAIMGLIFIEPDRGTTILLGLVTLAMLLVAGVRWSYVIPPALLAVGALALSLWNDPMRSERIYSWWHLEETRLGKGHQAYQAMLALGSGGIDGLGLGNGRQKLGFIPEHHTDFIFSIIGEELGVIATISVVILFFTFVICGLYIAYHAKDSFSVLMAVGITFLIGIQAFINIGVVTSALPNKGMPLPFISYGGSNLLVLLTLVGILLNIAKFGAIPGRDSGQLQSSELDEK